jgi:pimeloyl-ACP methyl ester carboxylesterase
MPALPVLVLTAMLLPAAPAMQSTPGPAVKTVRVNEVDLAYVEQGSGPIVLFVHGSMGDWRTWQSLSPFIAPHYRYVSLSRRYHYPNPWSDKGEKYSRAQHVEDIAAFIRALGGQKVHLVGNSYGGGLAARVALKYPELLRSVVIGEAAGLIPPQSAATRAAADALQQELAKARDAAKAGRALVATRLHYDAVVQEPGAFERLSPERREQRVANAKTIALSGAPDPTPSLTCAQLRELKVPALVVRGEKTRLNFRLGVEELLPCLPAGTELAVIPRGRHAWHADNPEDSAKAILAFIRRHDRPAEAAIAGCIVDRAGAALPGATVIAKTGGVERTTTANAAGCYEFGDLPPASYSVTGRLLGFDNVTRDRVTVVPSVVTRFDFTMTGSSVCECVNVPRPRTLAEASLQADAVLHVRIAEPPPDSPVQSGTYRHAVTVLHVLKPHGGLRGSETATVVELQNNGASGPADPGQEFVVLAYWDARTSAFFGLGSDCCPTRWSAFVVRDERIARTPAEFRQYVGMPIDRFLDEVRAASIRSPRAPL